MATLAFTGDTMPTEAVLELAANADLLVHDAALSATLTPEFKMGAHGHSSAEAAAELARRWRAAACPGPSGRRKH